MPGAVYNSRPGTSAAALVIAGLLGGAGGAVTCLLPCPFFGRKRRKYDFPVHILVDCVDST